MPADGERVARWTHYGLLRFHDRSTSAPPGVLPEPPELRARTSTPISGERMSSTTNGTDAPRRILVVVPAHNEEECIVQTLKEIQAAVPEANVVVVDDGSQDGTADLARNVGVDVLALSFNLGVGGAMRAAYKYAQASGFDAVVQVDADGQHDPYEIPTLLATLGQGPERDSSRADVVIGARFAGKGDYDVRGPRRWTMRTLAALLSRMARTELTDTTSGFRASNQHAIALYARHYPAEYLGDTIEAIVIALRSGFRVSQVPVSMRPRQGGRPSHRPFSAGMYMFRAVFALGLARVRRWPDYAGLDREHHQGVEP